MLREKLLAAFVAVAMFGVVNGAIVGIGLATSDSVQAQQAFKRGAEQLAQQDAPRAPAVVRVGSSS